MSEAETESLEISDAVRDGPLDRLNRASSVRSEPTLCRWMGETGSACCSFESSGGRI